MKNVLAVLSVVAVSLLAVGCADTPTWEEGFHGVKWGSELEDVRQLEDVDELILACRRMYYEQYTRVDDVMVMGPAPTTGAMMPLYEVLYGFCNGRFCDVTFYVDQGQRASLEHTFAYYFGQPQGRDVDTVTYQRGKVMGQISTSELLYNKTKAALTYLPLKR